jgi:hypothetical protein
MPPLKAASGSSSSSGSISIAMPLGGRPLVTAKSTPSALSLRTAATARSVRAFSEVTSVPSTSASSSLTDRAEGSLIEPASVSRRTSSDAQNSLLAVQSTLRQTDRIGVHRTRSKATVPPLNRKACQPRAESRASRLAGSNPMRAAAAARSPNDPADWVRSTSRFADMVARFDDQVIDLRANLGPVGHGHGGVHA